MAALAIANGCGDDTSDSSDGGGGNGAGGGSEGGAGAGGMAPEGGGGDGDGGAGGQPAEDKAALCDSEFGEELTAAYGRLDGTVLAVVRPVDTQCPLFNDDHVVLEVTMNGATYRAVINILSTFGDPDVRLLVTEHELPGEPWSEGWHTGVNLDYVVDLGAHNGPPFEPVEMMALADRIADEITIGQKVSIFSESSGGSSSHKIHRNGGNRDGALVLDADGPAPKMLLFHFANQQF